MATQRMEIAKSAVREAEAAGAGQLVFKTVEDGLGVDERRRRTAKRHRRFAERSEAVCRGEEGEDGRQDGGARGGEGQGGGGEGTQGQGGGGGGGRGCPIKADCWLPSVVVGWVGAATAATVFGLWPSMDGAMERLVVFCW